MVYVEQSIEEAFAKPFAAPILDLSEYLNESIDFDVMVSLTEADEVDSETGEKKGFGKAAWEKIRQKSADFAKFCSDIAEKIRIFFGKVMAKVQSTLSEKYSDSLLKQVNTNKDLKLKSEIEIETVNTAVSDIIDALGDVVSAVGSGIDKIHDKTINDLRDVIDGISNEITTDIDAKVKKVTAIDANFSLSGKGINITKGSTKVAAETTVGSAYDTNVKPIINIISGKIKQVITIEKTFNDNCKETEKLAKVSSNKSDVAESDIAVYKKLLSISRDLITKSSQACVAEINTIVKLYKVANSNTAKILRAAKGDAIKDAVKSKKDNNAAAQTTP